MQINTIIVTLLLGSGPKLILAQNPFTFDGGALAKSNKADSIGMTTLYATPDAEKKQVSGAEFTWQNGKESSVSVGLVTVYLDTPLGRKLLITKFAPIAQACSCYWLEANELKKRFNELTSGNKFSIVMESDQKKFTVSSGKFAIDFGGGSSLNTDAGAKAPARASSKSADVPSASSSGTLKADGKEYSLAANVQTVKDDIAANVTKSDNTTQPQAPVQSGNSTAVDLPSNNKKSDSSTQITAQSDSSTVYLPTNDKKADNSTQAPVPSGNSTASLTSKDKKSDISARSPAQSGISSVALPSNDKKPDISTQPPAQSSNPAASSGTNTPKSEAASQPNSSAKPQ